MVQEGPRSIEEMSKFPLAVSWVHEGEDVEGEVTADDGYLWLESNVVWPVRQSAGTIAIELVEITGSSARSPFYLRGTPINTNENQRLRVDDLRVGSSDPDELIVSATPSFDYADEAVRYYQRDGAARRLSEPLILPALDIAPEMSLFYAARGNHSLLEFRCPNGASIEQIEIQLDSLQRLITFSAQLPSSRHQLTVRNRDGDEIEIYRGVNVIPQAAREVDYRDFALRLSRSNTQTIVDRWWAMMADLRPIPQIITSLKYQRGYAESDFFLLATVLDRLGEAWTDVPGLLSPDQYEGMKKASKELKVPEQFTIDNHPIFHSRMLALLDTLSEEVWANVRIDRTSWLVSMKRHRNLVAHSSEQKKSHREFMTGPGLPALRAATDVIVTLVVAQHLGVEGQALAFAADRRNTKQIKIHELGVLAFNNKGIERPFR